MDREDYFKEIEVDNGQHVNISSGEIDEIGDQVCLLQVGTEMAGYACAYLYDEQVKELITTLQEYLACKPRN